MDDPRQLRALLQLRDLVDDGVEEALHGRLSLADALSHVLPRAIVAIGVEAAFVRTYDENLALSTFTSPDECSIPGLEDVLERTGQGGREIEVQGDGIIVLAQPIDVSGEWFGSIGIVATSARFCASSTFLREALHVLSEELDNYFYSVHAAREKHRLMMDLGEALRDRVLAEGVRRAVQVLARSIPLDRLLLVCVGEDRTSRLQVQVFEGGQLVFDTMGALPPSPDHPDVREEARRYLADRDPQLIRRFAFEGAREEVLINGITEAVVVGKILAISKRGDFNLYDRELIAAFSEFIRQRIVDFDKEWRTLACAFRQEDVARLLQAEDYARRYLAPREREVAILYADLSGFTRLSEQVLKTPIAVADLVEGWSRDAVDLVFRHCGVFDKMVGDCIIALFGPPFFDESPEACLRNALTCAQAIRDMTRQFPERPGFEHLGSSGLGVSTGVNLAPLFVGRFGPNQNFTGFSSGMNNTARLQCLAEKHEILVMDGAVARLGNDHSFRFGESRSAKVKNVAEPLAFRTLL
jgi:class 3 adenylate cyclase